MRAQFTTKRRVTMNYKKYLEDQLQTSRDKKDLLHFGRIFDRKTSFQQFDQSWNLR